MDFVRDDLILSDGTVVNANELRDLEGFQERQRAAKKAAIMARNRELEAKETGRICPFNRHGCEYPHCKRDCGLFCPETDSCSMAAHKALRDTKDKPCPFLRQCRADCALYAGGCALTNTQFA